jgi:hypothetical protein
VTSLWDWTVPVRDADLGWIKQGESYGRQVGSLEIKVAESRAVFPFEPQQENRQISTRLTA